MDNSTLPPPPKAKKYSLFSKIENEDDALKTIKDSSNAFLVIAGLTILFGVILAPLAIVDGLLYIILALLLRHYKSRVVAVLLMIVTLGAVVITFLNLVSKNHTSETGGNNIFLVLIMLWAAVRSIDATFKYHKHKQNTSIPNL